AGTHTAGRFARALPKTRPPPSKAAGGFRPWPAKSPGQRPLLHKAPAWCCPNPWNQALSRKVYATMTLRSRLLRALEQEDLNFLLTNRIPRRLATSFMGWFSRIEQPLVRDLSIGIWRFFSDLDLSEAKKDKFRSMHDCFIRELKDGVRPVDPNPEILVSPCDAIVGASGTLIGTKLLQIKGSAYSAEDLLCDPEAVALYRNGRYVTLRLTSGMYHRFHAPHDCRVDRVTYLFG